MQPTATVLVYSDDANTREQVRLAAGRRPAADVPPVEFLECATMPAVLEALDRGGIDVCVLDGETAPAGGMGVCRRDQGRDLPVPAGAAADRAPAGRLAGHLEPCGRRGDPAGRTGRVRGRPGRPAAQQGLRGRLRPAAAPSAVPPKGSAPPRSGQTSGRSRAAWIVSVRSGAVFFCKALPFSHLTQDRFQSPKPLSNGVIVSPWLPTTVTMSPGRTVL